MRYPLSLAPGSRVALLAPSGPVPSPDRLDAAVASVEALGLVPVVYPTCSARYGYLAGTDAQRAADLQAAFADPAIDGILCIRGGYGALRMLPLLDLSAIARTPKVFCGYSDVTALHTVFNRHCGFVTYHTPMPATEWYTGLDGYTRLWLEKALFGGLVGELQNPQGQPFTTLAGGVATGVLTGGNLSLLAASAGTPYEVDTAGKILFLEDVDEKPYRVDSMLTQLRNAGKLAACAGIVLGTFTNCTVTDDREQSSLTLEQIFRDLLGDLGIPVISGLCCGHAMPTLSLPMGAIVTLDANHNTLTVKEE